MVDLLTISKLWSKKFANYEKYFGGQPSEEERRVNSLRSNLRGKARLSGPPIKQTKTKKNIRKNKSKNKQIRLRGALRLSGPPKNTNKKEII